MQHAALLSRKMIFTANYAANRSDPDTSASAPEIPEI